MATKWFLLQFRAINQYTVLYTVCKCFQLQVKVVMSMLPKHIIERGQQVTKDILEQVMKTDR